MRWQKIGKIFDPCEHALADGCVTHAQSPQALLFDDFVRVYFSTRAPDGDGKFISHAAFVDFDKDFKQIRGLNRTSVVSRGTLGAFDEHGIFPFSPVRIKDRLVAYTTGWTRRSSVSVDTGIGLVVSSDDGTTFNRYGDGPVLSSSLNEPFLVCDGFVRDFNNQLHMWYLFGTTWRKPSASAPPDRTYKIGHAVSEDGITWRKQEAQQIISDRLGADESQALPSVIRIRNRYHMFFCYRQSFDFRTASGRGYQIGHAWSDDLEHWVRDDDNPALLGGADDWDSDMQCYPHIFDCEGRILLLYNGNEFGRAGFGLAELII